MEIKVLRGDITKVLVDAVVNAANTSLLGGGGVDGAIHKAGGPDILEDCRKIRSRQGGCKVGEAVITTAGDLPAKHVIHTVGPVWNGGESNEEELLKQAYNSSLQLALDHDLYTIAFPNISTGIYRFPKNLAAEIAVRTAMLFLKQHPRYAVVFVCFDEENFNIYDELLTKHKISSS